MKYLVITTGLNHTGKSTFGKNISFGNNNITHLDNDIYRQFVVDNYPGLREKSKILKSKGGFDVRGYYLSMMLDLIGKIGNHVVVTNCHMLKSSRKWISDLGKKNGFIPILIYFDIPYETLLERAKNSASHKNANFYRGASVLEKNPVKRIIGNLERMKEKYEIPNKNEVELFYRITTDNFDEMIEKITYLLYSSK